MIIYIILCKPGVSSTVRRGPAVIVFDYFDVINGVLTKSNLPDKQLFAKGGLVAESWIG